MSLGLDKNLGQLCLKVFENNVHKSIHFINENSNILNDYPLLESKLKELIKKTTNLSDQDIEKSENARKIIKNLKNEISQDDEAYLDFNLDDDAFFINKYYSLLN
jgi:hypothetical protein